MFEITYFDGYLYAVTQVAATDVMSAIQSSGVLYNQIIKVERVAERR